jgi:hypothetical protein
MRILTNYFGDNAETLKSVLELINKTENLQNLLSDNFFQNYTYIKWENLNTIEEIQKVVNDEIMGYKIMAGFAQSILFFYQLYQLVTFYEGLCEIDQLLQKELKDMPNYKKEWDEISNKIKDFGMNSTNLFTFTEKQLNSKYRDLNKLAIEVTNFKHKLDIKMLSLEYKKSSISATRNCTLPIMISTAISTLFNPVGSLAQICNGGLLLFSLFVNYKGKKQQEMIKVIMDFFEELSNEIENNQKNISEMMDKIDSMLK